MSGPNNYIPDVNRFALAGPPDWWLRKLWDFDNSLVIIPSRQGFYYRLAQRRKLRLTEKVVNEALFKESDTQMLATYSLVPVTTIVATANWDNPFMFEDLASRAPWRMGGADKVNKMLEDRDIKDDIDKKVKINEHLSSLGKDGWGLYRKKIGLQSQMWSPKTPAKKKEPQGKAPSIIIKP